MSPSPQKIIPHLWFDHQAEEAAHFYTSLFDHSSTGRVTRYGKEGFEIHGQPEGRVMVVDFTLGGYHMIALNGGPLFTFTPAISFFVTCESAQEIDTLWQRLSDGGVALMALDRYPWSERYGWVQDRYGLSWQLTLGKGSEGGQKITPALMFVGAQNGRAEEAMQLYTSLIRNSAIVNIVRAPSGPAAGTVQYATFTLHGEQFIAMDSDGPHQFTFNEAVSLLVQCESQDEIDFLWDRLSEGGDAKAQACGWLKDKFGVSWQITPREVSEMLQDPDPTRVGRVMKSFLKMKKIDLDALRRAYNWE